MTETFPYQLVGFLGNEPAPNEPVYDGKNGWYPQVALKRRFAIQEMSEETLLRRIDAFCSTKPLRIIVGGLVKTERMPVRILQVEPTPQLLDFHTGFINMLGNNLLSRYPEREGDNYLPHITAEYCGKMVIDTESYINREFVVNRVWLLKDAHGHEATRAYAQFTLNSK